jgi:hypothetical protein
MTFVLFVVSFSAFSDTDEDDAFRDPSRIRSPSSVARFLHTYVPGGQEV